MAKPLHLVIAHHPIQARELYARAVEEMKAAGAPAKTTAARMRIEWPDRATEWVPAAGLYERIRGRRVASWEAVDGVVLGSEVRGYLGTAALV